MLTTLLHARLSQLELGEIHLHLEYFFMFVLLDEEEPEPIRLIDSRTHCETYAILKPNFSR